MVRLGFRLTAAILAAGLMTAGAIAQEAKGDAGLKPGKGGGKYEEHYELLPPEGDPGSEPAPASGGLDPEGGAEPPRPAGGYKAASPPRPANRTRAAAPSPEPEPQPEAAAPPPRPQEMPRETTRVRADRPAAATPEVEGERRRAAADRARVSESDGEDAAGVAFFYEALEKGGSWQDHPGYGEVFVPEVAEDWRPYTIGRWAYSEDFGWAWVSEEPFGWATFHYGRWAFEAGTGWMWIPGTEWAPAWVVWRQGEDAIGWAPLPPQAQFSGSGLKMDAALIESERFENAWVFVRPRYFAMPGMRRFVRPQRWNADLVHATAPRVGYQRGDGVIANRGIAVEDVERLAGRPVPRVKITTVDDPGAMRPGRLEASRAMSELRLYKPSRKRMEAAVRKAPRRGEESARAAERDRMENGNEDQAAGSQRKTAAHKKSVKFAPLPVEQRSETEGGVTQSWLPAPAKAASETPARVKEAVKRDAAESESRFKSKDTAQGSQPVSADEKPARLSKAPASAPPRSAAREPTAGGATEGSAAESRRASRQETYSKPSARDLGEEADSAAAPQRGGTTGSVAAPAPVPASKRRWDGSGASGAPTAEPGVSGPGAE